MRGNLFLVLSASLLLIFTVAGAQAEQVRKVSPDRAGFTILPITNGDPSGPPTDNQSPDGRGPLLDPTVPASGPGVAAAAVPEPSTIAMLFLGFGCAGALIAFRRRRRA